MNELQTILADTCTRLFTDHVTTAVLEAAEKGEWPAALWQALEENGLTLPQIPEAHGGGGRLLERRLRGPDRGRPLRGAGAAGRDHPGRLRSWPRRASTCRSGP